MKYLLAPLIFILSSAANAQSGVYLCKDDDGRKYYAKDKIDSQRCKKIDLPNITNLPKKKEPIPKPKVSVKGKGGVRIGMTQSEALASNWGKPKRVNRTTTANSVTEQWVYGGNNYLYFDNGILRSFSN